MLRYLAHAGNISSVISLAVSIYVALSLRKIRNTYIFRARAPRFVKALQSHASTLIQYGSDFANSRREIEVELTKIDVRARTMQSRMPGESKRAAKRLRIVIKEYEVNPDNLDKFYAVYKAVHRVIEEVKELREDLSQE